MSDFTNLTIRSAHEGLKSKTFSAVELVEQYKNAAQEANTSLNAYLEIFDDAIDQAQRADDMIAQGDIHPLTGIPLGVKDNILIKGHVASAASKILENHTAQYEGKAIANLREHGAIFLGRTNMDEFAMGASTENSAFGVAKNPHDETRVPGGSSGGSAAAVAAGIALGALGSDTAGSIRQPAGFCGVVGFKPTYGSVSRNGLIALGSSLDVIGPLTKTVEDAEYIYDVIRGKDPMDSTTVDVSDYANQKKKANGGKYTIGIPRELFEHEGIDPRVKELLEKNITKLTDAGCTLVDIELPYAKYGVPAYYVLLPAEASSNLARFDGVKYGFHEEGKDLLGDYLKTRQQGFGPEPRRRIILGTYVLSAGYYDAYYNKAQAVRRRIMDDFDTAFKDVDAVILPTSPTPAFKLGEKANDPVQMYLEDVFTVPANHTGLPAISVPAGTVEEDGKDLPVGIQFYAPHMHEKTLFDLGKIITGE